MHGICRKFLELKELSSLPEIQEGGKLPFYLSGVSEVSRAIFAAALQQKEQRPLLVVCAEEAAAENYVRDLEALGEEPVLQLGSREFTFFRADAVSRQEEQKRLQALYRMQEGFTVTVATIEGLRQRCIPPETLRAAALTYRAGQEVKIEDLLDALLRIGYEQAEQVEGPGQFSHRGGILDVFSSADTSPVRFEFWGDEIDTLSYFDIFTQRRTEPCETCLILPAAETLLLLRGTGALDLERQIEAAEEKIRKKRKTDLREKWIQILEEDREKLRQRVTLPFADRYLPYLYEYRTALDYLPENTLVFLDEPGKIEETLREEEKRHAEDFKVLESAGYVFLKPDAYYRRTEEVKELLENYPVFMAGMFTSGKPLLSPRSLASVQAKQLPSYNGTLRSLFEDLRMYQKRNYSVLLLAGDARRRDLLLQSLGQEKIKARTEQDPTAELRSGECVLEVGTLSGGLELPQLQIAILTETQIRRSQQARPKRRRSENKNTQKLQSYTDLHPGDLVVHEYHGIGTFAGLEKITVDGFEKDYLKIEYAGNDCLYVPCTQMDLVSKYIGGGEDAHVKISRLGGSDWQRSKTRAKASAKEMAQKLLKLYAERSRTPGFAFDPDNEWQREFEDNFEYTETDDQLRCTEEIKRDMEQPVPMDRILCGDVGYGKTEVALRAVMKCILSGKQAALLCPTTVLAKQHYETALHRFYGFPVNIRLLSRYQTGADVRRDIASGKCDLVIGTHRLLQKDVKFHNLGLLIVDEEQRFGVSQKEHIKEISKGIDILTLSATPIPRTMNMALSGLRDISYIEEPPQNRVPVQTFVVEQDWSLLTEAIRRELQRGGQVYYLHNRIEDIERTAHRLQKLLGPEVRIGIAHGKMDRRTISEVMDDVTDGQVQVLVCTTIIETGIDIPNVNTLIIEDADRMGLAQLHQIRGRVGRSSRQAVAYLTFRKGKVLTEVQEKRLSAIREFVEFGSGFKIAMRDLEIRGAGSLLGAEQSGHMTDVGYDMYLRLLEEAVREEKGEPKAARIECSADLAVQAHLPESYISSQAQRMDIYRRISAVETKEEAEDLMDELIDRYGDPPDAVDSLLRVALLRAEAGRIGMQEITQKAGSLYFTLCAFDLRQVSALYGKERYKGRLRVEAGTKPRVSLRLKGQTSPLTEAEQFVRDWKEAGSTEEGPENRPKTV